MKTRGEISIGSVAFVAMLTALGACSDDDGPNVIAKGTDVELKGENDLGGQTLDIVAEEEDGAVTGEIRFSDVSGEVVVSVECADTQTDDVVILGGTITEPEPGMSGLVALFIRKGDPDSVNVWLDLGESESCSDMLANTRHVLDTDSGFVDVLAGSNIETD